MTEPTAKPASKRVVRTVSAQLTILIVACLPALLRGQTWQPCTSGGGTCLSSGNAGIGTATPAANLVVNMAGAGAQTPTFWLQSNNTTVGSLGYSYPDLILESTYSNTNIVLAPSGTGNVGIGTVSPVAPLAIGNGSAEFSLPSYLKIWAAGAGIGPSPGTLQNRINLGVDTNVDYGAYMGAIDTDGGSTGIINVLGTRGNGGDMPALYLRAGNVGIGVINPVSKLAVNGTISASEVAVTSSPADYVFDPSYRLAPLTEVAAYVEENHHLPEIPSAKEVEEKGVSLGEMQSKLLAKIEELTLHMIQADAENLDLRARIARLEAGVDRH